MTPSFKRRVFQDEWFSLDPSPLARLIRQPFFPLAWVLPPLRSKTYRFPNYALGWRVEATDAQMDLIRLNNMLPQPFITLRNGDPAITFAQALGPDWIPEINPNQAALLQVEAQVRAACVTWTHFLDSMNDSA